MDSEDKLQVTSAQIPTRKVGEKRRRGKGMGEDKDTFEYRFERYYFQRAWARAEKMGISIDEFSDKVFVGRKYPRRVFYQVKDKGKNGQPQRVRLAEALRMAKIVGSDFPRFTLRVLAELEDLEEQQKGDS